MSTTGKSRAVKKLSAIVGTLMFMAPAPSVLAAGATSVIMEEILVYGTKSTAATAAQDIPSQVAAFGADQLEAKQVFTIEDLSFSVPNVYMDSIGTQKSNASFSIRGLGIDNSTPSIDPNVGVFIDGIYAGVGFGVVVDTFDLESVEVYKGPQSLLFGRNVTGGAVLMRSKRPSDEFTFDAKLGYEEGESYTAALAVGGNIIEDKLSGRVAIQFRDKQGWHKNKFLDKNTGGDTSEFFRGSLLFTPTENLDLTLILEAGKIEGDGTPVQFETQTVGFVTDARPFTPDSKSFNIDHDFVGVGNVDWNQVTFEVVYQLGAGQITNTMGYREVDAFASADVDGNAVTTSIVTEYGVDQHQFSNELRYNVTVGDNWDTTLGVSFFTQEYAYTNGLIIAARDTDLNGNDRFGGGLQDQESLSFYWNNEYRLTDNFAIVGGINYLTEKKDVVIIPRLASTNTEGVCSHLELRCNWSAGTEADDDWSNWSPKLGFTFQVFEDAQVYGHVTRAYRSGFFNMRTPFVEEPVATDVEKHTAYELGIKSTLADGKVRLNGAIFSQDIDDLARSSGTELDGAPVQDLLNVGDARIAGFELDALVQIGDNLIITAAVGFLDGDLKKVTADINNDGFIDDVDKGLDITRLSEWTTSIGVIYDLEIGDSGVLTLRADHGFRDKSANRDDNFVFTPKVNMVNAGMTYRPHEGSWSVSVYGKNILDDIVYSGLFPLSATESSAPGFTMFAPVQPGRRFGMEFRYEM